MPSLVALVLIFFTYTGYCTLATGVALDPALAAAAAVTPVLPHVAVLGRDSAFGALRTLARLRVERHLRLARVAGLPPSPTEPPRRVAKPRAPMRTFTTHVSWAAVLQRYNALEFRQAHGLSYDAFVDLVERIRPLVENDLHAHGGQRNGQHFSAELQLHMVLRWLRGGQFHDFILAYGVSTQVFYRTAWKVCRAICATHVLPMAEAVAAARRGDESHFRRWAAGFSAFTLDTPGHHRLARWARLAPPLR